MITELFTSLSIDRNNYWTNNWWNEYKFSKCDWFGRNSECSGQSSANITEISNNYTQFRDHKSAHEYFNDNFKNNKFGHACSIWDRLGLISYWVPIAFFCCGSLLCYHVGSTAVNKMVHTVPSSQTKKTVMVLHCEVIGSKYIIVWIQDGRNTNIENIFKRKEISYRIVGVFFI